ncbi:MAG: Na+/H+ antiporter subunit E [Pararhodobacter sp.]
MTAPTPAPTPPPGLIGPRHKALLQRGAVMALVWAVLAAGDPAGVALGLLVVPGALFLAERLMPAQGPFRLARLMGHVPRFLAGSVIGGVDVARRALAPAMSLAPGWVSIATDLPQGGRVLLGGELSLMPGTLAAGCDKGRLIVHVLDRHAGFHEVALPEAQAIAAILGQDARHDHGAGPGSGNGDTGKEV